MTNPPTGGSASTSTSEAPPATSGAGAGTPSTPPAAKPPSARSAATAPSGTSARETATNNDFGATTLSGRTAAPAGPGPTAAPDAPPFPTIDSRPDGLVEPGTGLPGEPPDGAVPPAAAGSTSGIRGIRTGRNRGPRRARLQIRHINPVTVLKFSCVLAVALFFVWLIVIGVLFGILDAAGVITNINDTVLQLRGGDSKPPITAGIVFGGAAIVGVIYIVLFIALSTMGAVIYNLCADLVGGIEITLSER